MFCIITKRHVAMLLGLMLFVILFSSILWNGAVQPTFRQQSASSRPSVVIIDPGHGGEDGGAVAADGTVESGINLSIALKVEELLFLMGQETEMTRREDISIYSQGAETLREKKVSDLHNRVDLVNGMGEGTVLLSIHQNSLPQAKSVHGAQVFYNDFPAAETLAASIQQSLNQSANQGGEKAYKSVDSSVYLMAHIHCPGVLVECGFLSNVEESALLQTEEYQRKLALSVTAGYLAGSAALYEEGTA